MPILVTKAEEILLDIIERDDAEALSRLTQQDSSIVNAEINTATLLMLTTAESRPALKTAQLLINQKCELDKKDKNGYTVVHHAAEQGHLELLEMFLKAGANVNITTKAGYSPLYIACQKFSLARDEEQCNKYQSIIKALLAHPKIIVDDGSRIHTPLLMSVVTGQRKNIKMLIAAGANPLRRYQFKMFIPHDKNEPPIIFSSRKDITREKNTLKEFKEKTSLVEIAEKLGHVEAAEYLKTVISLRESLPPISPFSHSSTDSAPMSIDSSDSSPRSSSSFSSVTTVLSEKSVSSQRVLSEEVKKLEKYKREQQKKSMVVYPSQWFEKNLGVGETSQTEKRQQITTCLLKPSMSDE